MSPNSACPSVLGMGSAAVVPAQAGTHNHQSILGYHWPCHIALLGHMGPRLREDDSGESLLHVFCRGNKRRPMAVRTKIVRRWLRASRLTGHPQRRYDRPPREEPIARLRAKKEEPMATSFVVNGKPASTDAPPATPLLWVLREDLKLTGTKFGCGTGLCGACMVHIDGKRAFACQTQVSQIGGKSVTTIEGLSPASNHPLQKAWLAEWVAQCGYCQSGQI